MNPRQFTTEEEAKNVLALHGPQAGGGEVFIPEYVGSQAPSIGDKLFHHIIYNNGFVQNAGLALDRIHRYGEPAAKRAQAAEMRSEGRWVIE